MRRLASSLTSIFGASIAAASASAATPSDLTTLQRQVDQWRQHASKEKLALAARTTGDIAECTDDAIAKGKHDSNGATLFQVGEDEYAYTTIDVGHDRVCYFMKRPLHRPLSLAEAIDVHDGQFMLGDLPSTPKVYSAAEIKAAEDGLAELIEAVRSGTLAPLDKKHPPSPLDQGHLVDCSHVDSHELASKVFGVSSGFIYNGVYTWGTVSRGENTYCVYLKAPFDRGLTAVDASALLMSTQLRMGLSDTYRRVNHIPEEKPRPDLDKMIAAVVDHFGDAASPANLPKDLIDCGDIDVGSTVGRPNVGSMLFSEWMLDGPYWWTFSYLPSGTCVVASAGEDSRGLSAKEASALLKMAHSGFDDPKHAKAQYAFNCGARVQQGYGGNIPGYESGSINGRRYRAFYAALDPDLKQLDDVQHAYVSVAKERWKHLPEPTAHRDAPFDIEISVRTTGRTRQLATLEAVESTSDDANFANAKRTQWMLHIPTGRLLTFEDLFVDPSVMHERIVADYLNQLPREVESMMRSIAFIGDDPEQRAMEYHDRYLRDARRLATAPAKHWLSIEIGVTGEQTSYFLGAFSLDLLPNRAPPYWNTAGVDLQSYFKPEFRAVLDSERCPEMPPDT